MTNNLAWWQTGVFYQIYPRSFQDANGDGVGDLEGILQRLDYLVELGVDAVWISPIYPSPMADFGYDVRDYTGIHPLFGDMKDFDRLLSALHERGLRLVLDYVPNHTSDEHPWFLDARSSRDNPHRDWYIWRDPAPDGGPPNNWTSMFGGPAWTLDETSGQYYLHLFLDKQPDLNWRNPQVVEAMHNVLRFWLDKGVDGFRMDVVTFLIKHAGLPDNPVVPAIGSDGQEYLVQEHRYSINQPEIHPVLRGFRRLFDAYPGRRVAIGETWFMDPAELATYYGVEGDELHIPFNFILLRQSWDAPGMRAVLEGYYAALPPFAQPNFVLGNHDVQRLATRYGPENHRSAGLLLLTLRGTPTMYYGDEIGMQSVQIPIDRLQDPVGKRNPGTDLGRDPERTPMQWSAGPNAGFCPPDVEPWLPLAADYPQVNVDVERAQPDSTLNFYKELLRLRRQSPALHCGALHLLDGLPVDVLAYTRTYDDERWIVAINFEDLPLHINLTGVAEDAERVLSTHFRPAETLDLSDLLLQPHEGVLLQCA